MQAGSSQLPSVAQEQNLESRKRERKQRPKVKGKAREAEDATVFVPPAAEGPVENQDNFVEDSSTWPWASLADTSVSKQPPVFTNDCRYFFSISGASVKIYATATGQVVSTLSSSTSSSASSSSRLADNHTGDITSVIINPRNTFQLITASLDGQIKIWDFLEASLLNTFDVGEPITHMCAHESMQNHVFVATAPQKEGKNEASRQKDWKILRVLLLPTGSTSQLPVQKSAKVTKIGMVRKPTGLAVSPSGSWLVATGGTKAYVCALSAIKSGFTKFVSKEELTCLAFHPTEEYFATGDQKGQIRLWYCLNEAQASTQSAAGKRAQTTTLHWHAHAVSSIAFTPNGSYLLSGGEEAVLVIWQLHTGKREFIPRVGAPIVSVSVARPKAAEEEYLLVLSDGTLVFIGAGTLRISRSFARIKFDPNLWSNGPAPLAVHALTSTLILPSSHPSSLLIYSPLTHTLLAELEVSPSNRVSRRDEKQIEPSRVDRVVVSDSGEWLATIDRREGGEDFERETYMKIWQWDSSTSTWNLNSRIDRPHGIHNVNGLVFTPARDQPLLVSIGDDGNVKVWRTRKVSNKKGELEVFWVCRSTLGYRSQIPTDAVCSPDGSLLAVALGGHAVVFELTNNVLRLALTCPEVKEISHLAFVGSSGRYIVVTGHQDLVLWDLISSSVRWHHHTSAQTIRHVVPHPKKDSFAVLYRSDDPHATLIHKFDVASSTPVSSPTLPFLLRQVAWYPYSASGNDFILVGVTQSWNTVIFGDRISLPEQEGLSARGIAADANPNRRNIFEDMFGTSAFQDFSVQAPRALAVQDIVSGGFKTSNPLNAPAYLLPPLHTLFTPLIDGLLRKQSAPHQVEVQEEDEQEEDEDVLMADAPTETENGRTFRPEEMDEFVELFKQQSSSFGQGNYTTSGKTAHVNGNGVPKTANGTHRHKLVSSTTHTVNGKNHPPRSPAERVEHTSDRSPAVVGKKRKKSMG